jgi:hypothetical protein
VEADCPPESCGPAARTLKTPNITAVEQQTNRRTDTHTHGNDRQTTGTGTGTRTGTQMSHARPHGTDNLSAGTGQKEKTPPKHSGKRRGEGEGEETGGEGGRGKDLRNLTTEWADGQLSLCERTNGQMDEQQPSAHVHAHAHAPGGTRYSSGAEGRGGGF